MQDTITGQTGAISRDWHGRGSNGQVIADGHAATLTFTPANVGTYTVTNAVTDSANPANNGSAASTITVTNVPPGVTLSGADAANEGDTKTYAFTTSDLGANETFRLVSATASGGTVSNSQFDSMTGAGSFDVAFNNAETSTVTVVVADADGGQGSASQTVSVAAVAPTVTLSGPTTANEGDTKTYSFTTTDPGMGDTFGSAVVAIAGNGVTYNSGSLSFSSTTGSGSFTVTFSNPLASALPATISVQVEDAATDNLLTGTSNTLSVAVAAVAPTVTWTSVPGTANEGQMELYTFTVSDPGSNDAFSLVSEAATGGTVSNATIAATAGTATGSFDVTFNQGTFTSSATSTSIVGLTVEDNAANNGLAATATPQSVTVIPVAPTVTLSGATTANEGDMKLYTFSVSDPDTLDTFTVNAPTASGGTITTTSGTRPRTRAVST